MKKASKILSLVFQLTPSRRATEGFSARCDEYAISTHALTEGDGTAAAEKRLEEGISTHALTEGDLSGA